MGYESSTLEANAVENEEDGVDEGGIVPMEDGGRLDWPIWPELGPSWAKGTLK